jgi:hypothetical protein
MRPQTLRSGPGVAIQSLRKECRSLDMSVRGFAQNREREKRHPGHRLRLKERKMKRFVTVAIVCMFALPSFGAVHAVSNTVKSLRHPVTVAHVLFFPVAHPVKSVKAVFNFIF